MNAGSSSETAYAQELQKLRARQRRWDTVVNILLIWAVIQTLLIAGAGVVALLERKCPYACEVCRERK